MTRAFQPSAAPILLTVSFNTVGYTESDYFRSRERWARAVGAQHVYVSESSAGVTLDAQCAAWLRIPLMLMLRDRDIFYLDSDCVIQPDCPSPANIAGGLSGFFMARGHSGRPNSGVILMTRHEDGIARFCAEHYFEPYPENCDAPWENAYVIWASLTLPWRPLHPTYNATRTTEALIVHHTGPNRPMRSIAQSPPPERFDFSANNVRDRRALEEMGARVLANLGLAGEGS